MFRYYSYTINKYYINLCLTKVRVVKIVLQNTSVCGSNGGGVAAYIGSLLVYVCCTVVLLGSRM